jgi:Na+-translocating ferredoxin:NAD+ oxidoreductase RNF subunit RnfB
MNLQTRVRRLEETSGAECVECGYTSSAPVEVMIDENTRAQVYDAVAPSKYCGACGRILSFTLDIRDAREL